MPHHPLNRDFEGKLREVQRRFLIRADRDLQELESLLFSWGTDERTRACDVLHALKGAAGSCGFDALGRAAAELERIALGIGSLADAKRGMQRLREARAHCACVPAASAPATPLGSASTRLINLLCIEDDPDIGRLVRLAGEAAGYRVEVVANGEDGWIRLVSGARPDVVLLDLMLPGLSGFEILQRARNHEELCAVRFVVLSARVLEGERTRAMDCGASAFLAKPFDIDELTALVDGLHAA